MFNAAYEALQKLEDTLADVTQFYSSNKLDDRIIYTDWNAHHVLAHLVSWHMSFARNLASAVSGTPAQPFKGKLSDINEKEVLVLLPLPIPELLEKLQDAQSYIRSNILNPQVTLIAYKQGSRPYSPEEHLMVVNKHISQHLEDVKRRYRS